MIFDKKSFLSNQYFVGFVLTLITANQFLIFLYTVYRDRIIYCRKETLKLAVLMFRLTSSVCNKASILRKCSTNPTVAANTIRLTFVDEEVCLQSFDNYDYDI